MSNDGLPEISSDEYLGEIIPALEAAAEENTRRAWAEAERAVLRRYYGRVPARRIAEHLGRSIGSVQNMVARMGLSA